MLGLACGVAIWWTRRRGWRWLAPIILAIAITGTGWSIVTGRGHASEVPESSTVSPSERKAWNVAVRRAVLWPRAWDGFLSAPLFGHGLGSYNDRPPDPAYMAFGPGLTAGFYGRPEHVAIFDDAHAHHSYLHLLYETGICGLTLSVLLLWALLRSLTPHLGRDRLADGLHIALWTIIFVSFTERGLAAPAIVLPWTTWYVWWFGARRCVACRGAPTGKTSAGVSSSLNAERGDRTTTKHEGELRREIIIGKSGYTVTLSSTAFKLVLQGRRKGLESKWTDLVSADAALATALNASVTATSPRQNHELSP